MVSIDIKFETKQHNLIYLGCVIFPRGKRRKGENKKNPLKYFIKRAYRSKNYCITTRLSTLRDFPVLVKVSILFPRILGITVNQVVMLSLIFEG
jgi:hypothetical protein